MLKRVEGKRVKRLVGEEKEEDVIPSDQEPTDIVLDEDDDIIMRTHDNGNGAASVVAENLAHSPGK